MSLSSRVLLLAVFACGLVACGSMADMASTDRSTTSGGGAWEATPSVGSVDGGVALASADPYEGSPLCRVRRVGSCRPDSMTPECNATGATPNADAGSPAPADASAPKGDAGTTGDAASGYDAGAAAPSGFACRVEQTGNEPAPVCRPAGAGKDGAECRAAADCAAGFECVGTPGQCRRYCCSGPSSCGTDRVCDKQLLVGDDVSVPVCVPLRSCKLLAPSACPANETCSIVDATTGKTGCLALGSATTGESCELANCAAGHACLGPENRRTCFKLCTKGNTSDCPSGLKCQGAQPLFADTSLGVCLKEVATANSQSR